MFTALHRFDGSMLSYLKTHQFSDLFLAGMRGICVVAGLLGTLASKSILDIDVALSFLIIVLHLPQCLNLRKGSELFVREHGVLCGSPLNRCATMMDIVTPCQRSELIFLAPVTLSFYVGAAKEGETGAVWNNAVLFSGF